MDWFPLFNSIRVAICATVVVFFLGLTAAYYVAKLPPFFRGIADVVFTLPLVLPPTVVGYLLLLLLGPQRPLGRLLEEWFQLRLTMVWQAAVVACIVVAFPLMYRTTRGAFARFDPTLAQCGATLGLSNSYLFWRVRLPYCKSGILAGTVLAFARALGEYGATSMVAGYTPGKTATISTTVYQFWRTGQDSLALKWVLVNVAISCVVLVAVNLLDGKTSTERRGH